MAEPLLSNALELDAYGWRLALRPDLGGCVAGLWFKGEAVLRSTEPHALAGPRQSACFPLLPYSNRVADRRFSWCGQSYQLQPNFPDSPHALHGVGWRSAWHVEASANDQAKMTLAHTADGDWPFDLRAEQSLTLRPDGLHITLRVTNTDTRGQPMGLGWHPYFPRRPDSRLRLQVGQRWLNDARHLPCQAVPQGLIDAVVNTLDLDNAFDDWSGQAWIDGARHALQLRSSCGHVVVFTPPGRDFFCIEPVSHVNNAVNAADPLARGLVALAPGAGMSHTFSITLSNPPP